MKRKNGAENKSVKERGKENGEMKKKRGKKKIPEREKEA